MTISILKREVGQKIARPFMRASDWQEARELLGRHIAMVASPVTGYSASMRYAEANWSAAADLLAFGNVETDLPVYERAGIEFFAFVEA